MTIQDQKGWFPRPSSHGDISVLGANSGFVMPSLVRIPWDHGCLPQVGVALSGGQEKLSAEAIATSGTGWNPQPAAREESRQVS